MIGLKKHNFGIRLFVVFGAAILITWLTVVFWLSNRYLNTMLNPVCLQPSSLPKGFTEIKIPFKGQYLDGWWTPPQNGAVILLFGGHGASQDSLESEVKFLAQAGYGVITTNYRHCLGKAVSFGWFEVDEFHAVSEFVKSKAPQAKIGVFGFSAGAISAIRGTAEQTNIQAITVVGNYASLQDEMITQNARPFSLRWQIERCVYLLYWLHTGISPHQVNILPELQKINPRPVLLIHGEYENTNNQADKQLQAAGSNAVLWIAPNSNHGTYLTTAPDQYRETVINFFDQNLP